MRWSREIQLIWKSVATRDEKRRDITMEVEKLKEIEFAVQGMT
jgi:hypothetical protein